MTRIEHFPAADPVVLARRLDAAAWGLFFLWIGIALMAGAGWGVGLLGVGVIAICGQVLRKYFGLAAEGFWTIVGLLFLIGGLSDLMGVQFSLAPIALIAAGAALLFSSLRKRSG